ncbi:hypothetical protein MPTK1_6g08230 [Marchantia polymorpha subsp. ruderalis]|uniref:Peptidase A1 domain-containing protein n=2 Tax=Marchantia polymorpha TaxID=3197 RepID=A0AAF6BPT4_MARPO|nr:hypothetical protein MARPO_0060s0098 [Marchantia polymorpha]BBN14018.1 hypothetical protein Mp_6g08230 [Marchantia polymorpha subsp. ruderalis]|eukprot:PTQ37027.1 hypothetical protein MARPO_0060s0098 [Marchantia polymorpha]
MASKAIISIVLLLTVQCAALNNQQTGWVTAHLKRPTGSHLHAGRHLGETAKGETATASSRNGWRASLIVRSAGTENFTILQLVHRDVEASIARGKSLDRKARNAPYHKHKGRSMLDFTTNIEATPNAYSMEISLGTPPQNFIAIADTGSDLVWLECKACTVCINASAVFDPSLSSTYSPLGCNGCNVLGSNELTCTPNCQYTYEYGDLSSTQGNFSLDTLTLQNTNGTSTAIDSFHFGCGLQNNGSFLEVDGLVGLARGPISFPSQIAPFLNNVNKFSYCLLGRYDPAAARSPLLFGESAVPTNVSFTVFTPQLTPYDPSVLSFYYVNLTDISVGGAALNIPASAFAIDTQGNGGVIFDSGTTVTLLNTVAYRSVVDTFTSQIDTTYPRVNLLSLTGLEVCYNTTAFSYVNVPTVVFKFDGADFDLPFQNIVLLLNFTDTESAMCLAMQESQGMSIFGSVQQQNFQVLYDEDNLQIGWVPTDCQTL